MRTKHILLLLALCLPLLAGAQKLPKRHVKKANEQTAIWRYEIESAGVATTGNEVIKVWSFSKKPQVAAEQSRKNAVHGIIFKGVPSKQGYSGKRPLVANEDENAEFFSKFFADGGDYARFVSLTTNGAVAGGDVMRTSNKEYRVGVVVTVSYNDLRRHLEENGVTKRLGAGF